jgi:hypothetical protein
VKSGFLNAGSVGGIPLKIELVEDKKDPTWAIFREMELIEFSICNVPANPFALRDPEPSDAPTPKKTVEVPQKPDDLEYLFGAATGKTGSDGGIDYLFVQPGDYLGLDDFFK